MMDKLLLLLLLIILHSALCEVGIVKKLWAYNCGTTGNYTTNSTYKVNLNTLLTSTTNIEYGFYNFSAGQEPNQVNGIALCRGDVSVSDCRKCVNTAAVQILQRCPNQKEVIVWYDYCMLRYSDRSIFGQMETLPDFKLISGTNISTSVTTKYQNTLTRLMQRLRDEAVLGDTPRKFASGSENVTALLSIYGVLQCTPDLSKDDCNYCLDLANGVTPFCCLGENGGGVLYPSCYIRFEKNTRFFSDSPANPPSTTPSMEQVREGNGSGSPKPAIIAAILVAASILLIVLVVVCLYCRRRETKKRESQTMNEETPEALQFSFKTIQEATENFSESNKLGQGGFGAVYKGIIQDGKEIAVKRLAEHSRQGQLEFKNEVLLVAKLQHRNLARLLGFCLEDDERLLIYEFVSNASLDKFLFDEARRAILDWPMRQKIVVGIARGLLYLHQDSPLRIIHRDIKASNILLNAEMNPKISDFGMARLLQVDQTHADTNRIVGTYGYMAPEYAFHGLFSIKSDVYSFGVMVLEILTGQRNKGFVNSENVENLITKMWSNWNEGNALSLVDTIISQSNPEITRYLHIGLLCLQENAAERPTMSSVVQMLSNHSLALPVPSRPAYVFARDSFANPQQKLQDASYSTKEPITVLHPR